MGRGRRKEGRKRKKIEIVKKNIALTFFYKICLKFFKEMADGRDNVTLNQLIPAPNTCRERVMYCDIQEPRKRRKKCCHHTHHHTITPNSIDHHHHYYYAATTTTIESLPDVVMAMIFAYLPMESIRKLMAVCKRWNKCVEIPCVWKHRWIKIYTLETVSIMSQFQYLRDNVRRIFIHNSQETIPVLYVLTTFKNAKSVHILNGPSTDIIKSIGSCFPGLKEIRISTTGLQFMKRNQIKICETFDLRPILGVTHLDLSLSGKKAAIPLFNYQKIKKLFLRTREYYCFLAVGDVLSHCTSLTVLVLNNIVKCDWGCIEELKNLRVLNIKTCLPAMVLPMREMKTLEELKVDKIEKFSFSRLGTTFPSLKLLDIDLREDTQRGAQCITTTTTTEENNNENPSVIEEKSMNRCQITNLGVTIDLLKDDLVTDIENLPRLSVLTLRVPKTTLKLLERVIGVKTLSFLSLITTLGGYKEIPYNDTVTLSTISIYMAHFFSMARKRLEEKSLMFEVSFTNIYGHDSLEWKHISSIWLNNGIKVT